MLSKKTDLRALRVEAEALAAFLRTEVRTFAKDHRPVELEADAPAAAAILWRAVGWSRILEKQGLVAPESETGEARIQSRMTEYQSWSNGFTLTVGDLPSKRRLVEDDGQGVGFAITDEQPGEIDARMVAVIADTNKIVAQAKSYTRYCAHTMAECAFKRMYQAEVDVRPAGAIAQSGSKPWPLLLPGVMQVAPDVYCAPSSAAATQPQRKGRYRLAHRSVEALVDFLLSLECEAVAFGFSLPGDPVYLNTTTATVVRDTDRLRELPSLKPEFRHSVGYLAGVPVLFRENRGTTDAHTNPRRLAELQALLKERAHR